MTDSVVYPLVEAMSDSIQKSLAWRKSELTRFRMHLLDVMDPVTGDVDPDDAYVVRSAIAILYAHWEGGVADVTDAFRMFIDAQTLCWPDLNQLLYEACVVEEKTVIKSRSDITQIFRDIEEVRDFSVRPHPLPPKIFSARSNLSGKQFCRILRTMGLQGELNVELRKNKIDELVRARNNIVHGERHLVVPQSFFDAQAWVLELLNEFEQIVVDYALSGQYLRRSGDRGRLFQE